MAKFSYDNRDECVAYICLLDDDPDEPILVLKNVTGSHTYIYPDGDILTQNIDCEDEAVIKFYPGDSVTITF